MEFTSKELNQLILGIEGRIVWWDKIYCNKIQTADEKGWSPVLMSETEHVLAKIDELNTLCRKLYDYKFSKNKEG